MTRPRVAAAAALLVLAVLMIYWPAVHGGFVFDDDALVTESAIAQAPDGLRRIWLTSEPIDYWPVTNSSFWLEWRLWGSNPTGYHVTNLILHAASALIVWAILRRWQLPGSFLAALLFAVHPVNVASVAWISQRKNTLALFFFLLSIWWFFSQKEGRASRPGSNYYLSIIAFTLAMLSKGSVAILPLLLVLLIWWRHRAVTRRNLVSVAPFAVTAAAFTIVNLIFQARTPITIRDETMIERVLGAGGVIWFYLWKAIAPSPLMFVYPPYDVVRWGVPLLAAIAWTAVLWRQRARPAARAVLVAWLFFVIGLLPVLGLVDVHFMRYSLVADHYQYVALIGVTTLAAAALWRIPRAARAATGATVVLALAVLTRAQAQVYADPETFYRTAVRHNPAAWAMQNNLGALLVDRGRDVEGADALRAALRLRPGLVAAQINLCIASARLGRLAEGIAECSKAVEQDPDLPDTRYQLGYLLSTAGRPAEALPHLEEVVRLRPTSAVAHNTLGVALAALGRREDAARAFRAALAIDPSYTEAGANLTKVTAPPAGIP